MRVLRKAPNGVVDPEARMDELMRESVRTSEPIPKGFRTMKDWAIKYGMTPQQMRHAMDKMMVEGKIEVRRFRVSSGLRGTYAVPHYRAM